MDKFVPDDAVLIPDYAQKVYQGRLFSVFEWDQKLFDGSYQKFEMIRRPNSVEIIVIKENQILILDEQQPNKGKTTNLPSGRVEPGESWQQAAERELLEETGFECENWNMIQVKQPLRKMEWFVATFVASIITIEQRQSLDGGESITAQWVAYEELRQRVLRGELPDMDYLMPLFNKISATDEFLHLPAVGN